MKILHFTFFMENSLKFFSNINLLNVFKNIIYYFKTPSSDSFLNIILVEQFSDLFFCEIKTLSNFNIFFTNYK